MPTRVKTRHPASWHVEQLAERHGNGKQMRRGPLKRISLGNKKESLKKIGIQFRYVV